MAISFNESVSVGFSDIWSRKVRSIVTLLGVLLGTMSIIVVMALVNGVHKETIQWMMERGGLNRVFIRRNWRYQSPTNQRRHFTYREVELIKSLLPEDVIFNPAIRHYGRTSYGRNEYWSGIRGVLPDFAQIEEWTADEGRFITDYDVKERNDVVVIGTTIKKEVFGNTDPVGKYLTINGKRLMVIGVMRHRFMTSMMGGNSGENQLEYLNQRCFIPLTTMIYKFKGENEIDNIGLKAPTVAKALELSDQVNSILLNLRRNEPIFYVSSAKERADEMKKDNIIFQLVFTLISGISLLVGGIVIMNIMLATIQERTREIGIRLAVGARRIDIFMQFLIQSILLTALGGILGIGIGVSILKTVGSYIQVPTEASLNIILVALTVSVGVGFVFGIFPSIIASNLDPVKALRYE